MKKHRRRRNLTLAIRSKAQISQQTTLTVMHRHKPLFFGNSSNTQGWYQFRKRAQNLLNELSGETLVIHENGYRGNDERHWMLNQKQNCQHVFKASVRDAITIGADRICPFCNGSREMERYGSISAIQEHVRCMTLDSVEFLSDNILTTSNEDYRFYCAIHKTLFESSFDTFLKRNGESCPICEHERATVGQ